MEIIPKVHLQFFATNVLIHYMYLVCNQNSIGHWRRNHREDGIFAFFRLFVGLSIKLAVTEQNHSLKLPTDFSNWYLIFFQQFFRKFLHSWLETHFWNQSFQKNRIWKRRKIPTWNQLQYWTQTQISTWSWILRI